MRRSEIERLQDRHLIYPCILVMYGSDKSDRIWNEYPSLFHTEEVESYEKASVVINEFFDRYRGEYIDLRIINCYDGELFECCF